MKKTILAGVILGLVILAGCGNAEETAVTKNVDEITVTEAVQNNEEAKEQQQQVTEALASVTEEPKAEIVIPDEETVLRFWADNYEDIVAGKYTGDKNRCLYVSAGDYDGDTMPELTVGFDDGRGSNTYVRFLDVNPELTEITYCKQVDESGKECDVHVPLEPMMMFSNEAGELHYICQTFRSEGPLVSVLDYDDICFNLKEGEFICEPTVTQIKEKCEYYVEDDMGVVSVERTEYFDYKGNAVTKDEYYNECGIYNYAATIGTNKAYKVNRYVVFATDEAIEAENGIYNALCNSYGAFALTEKSCEDPHAMLEGTWTLIKTSIEGDEEEWNPDDGEITVTFDDKTMKFVEKPASGKMTKAKAGYTLEYEVYYDNQELWYIDVEDFMDFEWVSFRIDDEGYINMMAIIRYSEEDYSSIYWTFKNDKAAQIPLICY